MIKTVFITLLLFVVAQQVNGQFIPLSNHYYNQLSERYASADMMLMSSVKPLLSKETDSVLKVNETLFGSAEKVIGKSLVHRKLFFENLLKYKSGNTEISLDPVFAFLLGTESLNNRKSWTNSRGLAINGKFGSWVSINTELYENQAVLPSWSDSITREIHVIAGEGTYKGFKEKGFDYSISSGYLSFTPSRHAAITLGYGKNIIGDGYRSMILSDASCNYPYLRADGIFKKFKYSVIYAQFVNRNSMTNTEFGYDRKWATMHYLQVLLWKRLNIGLFDAVVWENADSSGHRGFDVQYLNPVIFLRPIEFSIGSPDNALMGVTFNLRLNKHLNAYGQLLMDEFKLTHITSNDGWYGNKFGYQLGLAAWNIAGIPSLDARIEYNQARPYTYSHYESIQSYSHYSQSLAHPLGANFKELVAMASYRRGNWQADFKINLAMYGADTAGLDFGRNVLIPYGNYVNEFDNDIGQGLKTHLTTTGATLSYLLNRRTNLRIEAGTVLRNETCDLFIKKTTLFFFGIRTGLRNLYNDF